MFSRALYRFGSRRLVPLLLALLSILLVGLAFSQSPVWLLSDLGPTNGTLQGVIIVDDRVVFKADYKVEKRYDLYSAPVGGGAIVQLDAGLPPGILTDFKAEDGIVVFTRRDHPTGQLALYSVPATGGTPLQLSLPLPTTPEGNLPGTDQLEFVIDGGRVFYTIDQTRRGEYVLYSVPLTGGTPVRLSVELEDQIPDVPWAVRAITTSDDGSRVLYTLISAGSARLYSVAGTGGPSTMLSSEAAPLVEPNRNGFFLSRDGARAGYVTVGSSQGSQRLVSLPATGGASVDLAEAQGLSFRLTPDNQRVLFTERVSFTSTTLRSRIIDGSAAAIDLTADVTNYITDPVGTHIYYTVSNEAGLFRRPVTGGAEETVVADRFVNVELLRFSADGQWAIFSAMESGAPAARLFSYATAGGAPAQAIDDPVRAAGGLFEFRIVGQRAVYQAQSDPATPPGLYSVPLSGGASLQLNAPFAVGQDFLSLLAADPTRVFYGLGDRPLFSNQPNLSTLVKVSADGSTEPVVIDTSRAVVGDVNDFLLVGDQVFYLANQEVAERVDLYRVPLVGGPSVRLVPASPNASVRAMRLNPAGDHLLYLADNLGVLSLWSVAVSGGEPVQIGAAAPSTLSVDSVQFAQNGVQVVYRSFDNLVRAPTVGGNATVIDSNVETFVVSPNGAEIVYIKQAFPRQLWRVPATGGEPTLLGVIGGNTIRVTPDSTVVVYQNAGPFGDVGGFVAQPITGGDATPVLLTEGSEAVVDLLFAPNSSAVIYTVNELGPNFESTIKVKRAPLNGAAATILDTAVSGAQVYLQADLPGDRVLALSQVPSNNGTTSFHLKAFSFADGTGTTLYGPEDRTGSFRQLAVSSDASRILFASSNDLLSLPADGGIATQLNTLPLSGAFSEIDGDQVLFAADDTLYLTPLLGGTMRKVSGLPGAPLSRGQINTFRSIGTTVVYIGERDIVDTSRVGGVGLLGVRELYAADLAQEGFAAGFSATDIAVGEGEPVVLDISLGAAQSRPVQVDYRVVGGTAAEGVDYTLTPGPLRFAPGETMKRVPLTILERSGAQGSRTLILELSGPFLASALAQEPVRVTLTITDTGMIIFLPQITR